MATLEHVSQHNSVLICFHIRATFSFHLHRLEFTTLLTLYLFCNIATPMLHKNKHVIVNLVTSTDFLISNFTKW